MFEKMLVFSGHVGGSFKYLLYLRSLIIQKINQIFLIKKGSKLRGGGGGCVLLARSGLEVLASASLPVHELSRSAVMQTLHLHAVNNRRLQRTGAAPRSSGPAERAGAAASGVQVWEASSSQ